MMVRLVDRSASRGLLGRLGNHLEGFLNRLRKIDGGGRTASQVSSSYMSNLDSPAFRGFQCASNQLKLDSAVSLANGRDSVKVHK